MIVRGKFWPVLSASRNLSKAKNRRSSRLPGCLLPFTKVLPRKSTSELGRRMVQILVWPPIGPSATSRGAFLLPINFFTVDNSSGVMVAVRMQMGACLAIWIFTAKMFLRRPGRMLAQCPSSPWWTSSTNIPWITSLLDNSLKSR